MLNIEFGKIDRKINQSFSPFFKARGRVTLLYGGAGSGKSIAVAQKILLRCVMAYRLKGHKPHFWAFRKTHVYVRKSCFELFRSLISDWNLESIVKINKIDMSINFLHNGAKITCSGLDDSEKIKSIPLMTSAWLEEATEMNQADFNQVNLRIRGETYGYKEIILSFNPISKLNWVYRTFFEKQDRFCQIFHSSYKDNIFIDKEYKDELESYIDIDPNYHRVYALGEWGSLEGLVYKMWKTCEQMPSNFEQEIYGVDFGFNNPTAIVRILIKDQELFVEEVLYKTKMTNIDLCRFIKSRKDLKDKVFLCDGEDPNRIEEMRLNGITANPSFKGKGSVMLGINFIKSHGLTIKSNSVNILKEIQLYSWKKDRNDFFMEEPIKKNDHLLDAIRYGINNGKTGINFGFY